jgi:HEAT repeat protein
MRLGLSARRIFARFWAGILHTRPMRVRSRIAVAVLVAALLGGLACLALRPQEPRYRGKTLTYWLEEYGAFDRSGKGPDPLVRSNDEYAVHQIGPAAAPILLRLVAAKDTGFRKMLLELQDKLPLLSSRVRHADDCHRLAESGFQILRAEANSVAEGLVPLLKDSDTGVRGTAEGCFCDIGPAAVGEVPALVRLLDDKRPDIQQSVAMCLGNIGPGAEPAVPALIRLLGSDDSEVRKAATEALGGIGPGAVQAVPALVAAMERTSDPMDFVRGEWTLGSIGPGARAAAPFLFAAMTNGSTAPIRFWAENELVRMKEIPMETFIGRLQDTSDPTNWAFRAAAMRDRFRTNAEPAIPYLVAGLTHTNTEIQYASVLALGMIHLRPDLCVPAITSYVRSSESMNVFTSSWSGGTVHWHSMFLLRAEALSALARFKSAAEPALPTIMVCLQDANEDTRGAATNALLEIDPEAAAKAGVK